MGQTPRRIPRAGSPSTSTSTSASTSRALSGLGSFDALGVFVSLFPFFIYRRAYARTPTNLWWVNGLAILSRYRINDEPGLG